MSVFSGTRGAFRTQGSVAARPVDKNAVVITVDELQRMKQSCAVNTDKEGQRKTQDKKDLYEKSQARLKNWPNTLQAMRKKKDDDRIHRLEEEEIARRHVDAEEEELQVNARVVAIGDANKQLHDNQDIVKAFHSKMMMADVIQEREAQDKLKGRKKQIEKNIENEWIELEKQKMIEYDNEMKVKLEIEYKKKMDNANDIRQQHHDFKMNCIKGMQEEMLEGELIKKQVEDDIVNEKVKDQQRREKQMQIKEDLIKTNEEIVNEQDRKKIKEIEEEGRCQEFAKKKEQMDQLRKDKELEKFKDKQAEKQKMIERQAYELMMNRNQDVRRLNQQVAEAEDRANRLFEEQELRKIQMKEAIEKSRQQQISKRKFEKDNEKKEETEFAAYWKVRNQELANAEVMEKDEEKERNTELQRFLNTQMQQKQSKVENEFIEEQRAAHRAQALLDQQEKQFYTYAEQQVESWATQGKAVKPLVLELKGYKKRIQ